MAYKIIQTPIPDLLILEPTVYGDERGFFMESFNERDFCNVVGREIKFVQDNHSRSSKGVLRGLHYQTKNPQGKLVRVTSGIVYDVAVDIRESSPSFGKWFGLEISAENKRQLWIPPGFAHGFLVLSEFADFLYKTTEYYDPDSEGSINWRDPSISINWPDTEITGISEKDKNAPGIESLS